MARQSGSGLRFEQRMSDLEALMWNIEKDPWLNPNGGGVMVYDRPLDSALLRRAFAYATAEIPASVNGLCPASDGSPLRGGSPIRSSTSTTTYAT